MKRIIPILILLGIAAGALASPYLMVLARKNAAGGLTEYLSETAAVQSATPFGQFSSQDYLATKFVAPANGTIVAVDAYIYADGSPAMNLNAYIYTHDATEDDPDTQVGTGSDAVSASTLPGSPATGTRFSNLSATVSSGTTYWIVLVADAVSSSNYVRWEYTDGTTEVICRDDDGAGEWVQISNTKTLRYILYE